MSTNENTEILLDMQEEDQNENYSLQVNQIKLVMAFHILLKTSWSILQTIPWFWRCHKIHDMYHTRQQQAAGI